MPVDESCPVCRTADIVCGKWTLLLVRELSEGCSRFCELERSLAGISPRTLSLRLRGLEEEGIVERHTFPEVPPRVEYALTEKGRALDRKSTRLNSSHANISYAVFCLKKKYHFIRLSFLLS